MRTLLVSILFIFAVLSSHAQDEGSIPGGGNSIRGLPKTTASINVLGLLQFGPILQTEIRLGQSPIYLSPHFRYQYLGLATHLFFAQNDFTFVAPDNYGAGVSLRVLFDNDNSSNVGYFGFGLEYNQGTSKRLPNDPDFEETEFFQGLAYIANGGYRWRNQSGRFISVGINVGVNTTISDKLYFTKTPDQVTEFDNTLFIAMLDFSFGWEKQ